MSTVQATHSLKEITSKLAAEVMECAGGTGNIKGNTVISCFKGVVCVDLRMSILDLPEPLLVIYFLAEANDGLSDYKPAELAVKIEKIGAGTT